jgi:hypothetical protein
VRLRRARRATLLSITGHLPVVRASGCANAAGASLPYAPPLPLWRSAPWGRKSAGTKGAQGWAPESFCQRQDPEGGRQPEFLGALAQTTAGATLLPLCALRYRMIPRARNSRYSVPDPYPDRRRWRLEPGGLLPPSHRVADYRCPPRGSGRTGLKPGRPVPRPGQLRQESCSWESRSQIPKRYRRQPVGRYPGRFGGGSSGAERKL